MFFFRSQFSFWAFPHQSLCLCCPGARLQRKGEAVPFFPSFIAKLCSLFSNIPKGRSLYNHLVGCRSVIGHHHNFLLFLLCSCLHPLSTKCFLSPNILLFFLLSSSFLPPTKYFPSFHNKDQNFKKSFALFTWSIFHSGFQHQPHSLHVCPCQLRCSGHVDAGSTIH